MPQQNCPLCGHSAPFQYASNLDSKKFSCAQCSDFLIDGHCERYLAEMPEVTRTEIREKLREQAQSTAPGLLYVIREPRPEEVHGNGHGIAREMLIAEWVKLP